MSIQQLIFRTESRSMPMNNKEWWLHLSSCWLPPQGDGELLFVGIFISSIFCCCWNLYASQMQKNVRQMSWLSVPVQSEGEKERWGENGPLGMFSALLGFSCCICKMGVTVLPSKGSLANVHRRQYYDTASWEKKKAFIRSMGKETGGKAQLCLPDPGFGARLKGFQYQTFLNGRPFVSERFRCSGSTHVLGLWFRVGGAAVKGSQVFLMSAVPEVWTLVPGLVRNRTGAIWAGSAVTTSVPAICGLCK